MEPATKVLVRFIKAPNGHSRLREDMRNALVGVMVKAVPDPNCFIIENSNVLLEAIAAQRPPSVHFYWEEVLAHDSKPIFLGRSEYEPVYGFQLELITPLPSTSLHKEICRACVGLKIRLEPGAFEPQKNGFYADLMMVTDQLQQHNHVVFSRYVANLPTTETVRTLFLPAHTYKILP